MLRRRGQSLCGLGGFATMIETWVTEGQRWNEESDRSAVKCAQHRRSLRRHVALASPMRSRRWMSLCWSSSFCGLNGVLRQRKQRETERDDRRMGSVQPVLLINTDRVSLMQEAWTSR